MAMEKIKKFWNENKKVIIICACNTGAAFGCMLIGYANAMRLTEDGKNIVGMAQKAMAGTTRCYPVRFCSEMK